MSRKVADRSPGTQLVVFLVSKVGLRDAVRVASLIARWGMVARSLGREPTAAEFCVYWSESPATYYRHWGLFRRVWPGDKSPQRVWEWVEENVPDVPRGESPESAVAVLMTLTVPRV